MSEIRSVSRLILCLQKSRGGAVHQPQKLSLSAGSAAPESVLDGGLHE
jgi:hypothetical protein